MQVVAARVRVAPSFGVTPIAKTVGMRSMPRRSEKSFRLEKIKLPGMEFFRPSESMMTPVPESYAITLRTPGAVPPTVVDTIWPLAETPTLLPSG